MLSECDVLRALRNTEDQGNTGLGERFSTPRSCA
jgi:hypothetical protein